MSGLLGLFVAGALATPSAAAYDVLHRFGGSVLGPPQAPLIQGSDGAFYGATGVYGYGGYPGAVFRVNRDGTWASPGISRNPNLRFKGGRDPGHLVAHRINNVRHGGSL